MTENTSENQFCNQPDIAYVSPYDREDMEKDTKVLILTPWTVQNICYEVLKNYMSENSPQSQGYRFKQKYSADDIDTGIALEIAYNYKDGVIQKRPGIYVARGDAQFSTPTINQMIGINTRDSEKSKLTLVQMPVDISVVATNVGFAEQLAEYVFKIFIHHQENIRNDFLLRQFKLAALATPQLYLESKDHFLVRIQLLTTFDMGITIKADHLRLKTMSYTVFTSCAESPLLRQ